MVHGVELVNYIINLSSMIGVITGLLGAVCAVLIGSLVIELIGLGMICVAFIGMIGLNIYEQKTE